MRQKFDGGRRYRHAEHISWRRVEEEAVLLNLNTSAYFSVNGVGARIWEKLGAGACPDEIQSEICREFSVEPAEAQRHVQDFIHDLCAKELLIPR